MSPFINSYHAPVVSWHPNGLNRNCVRTHTSEICKHKKSAITRQVCICVEVSFKGGKVISRGGGRGVGGICSDRGNV